MGEIDEEGRFVLKNRSIKMVPGDEQTREVKHFDMYDAICGGVRG